ncbi:MAG: NAD-dependent epimerase/dehydratase family protein [Elusimicrobia bacterium]|nr:NAD-dependent epimerase/dehydratase family protein [Elusimicrobiota bacterium]
MTNPMTHVLLKDCIEAIGNSPERFNALKNETVFISGGTGFVGTWIAEMLAYLNDHYAFNTKMILLSEHAFSFSSKAPHLATRKDVAIVEKDVRNLIELPREVTYIIHAAANPDNRQHSSDPLKVMDVISRGTGAVLNAASRLPNIKNILNISSGLIYGPQPQDMECIPETAHGGPDCDSILSIYSEAKRYAETLCTAYRNQFKLPIVTVRPFAFIGPYQLLDKPWAINNFIRDSLLGGPIRILGDENTVRSYMYASDMAVWLLTILINGKPGQSYNVGSPNGISLKQLAECIASHFPATPEIVHVPVNKAALKSRFVPDVALAQKSLALTITVNINEAIKRTMMWHKDRGI